MRGGTKQKRTLLYDGSASPSSATSSEPALNRGDGRIAGTVPQSATDKSNVPFGDDIISQELQIGKIKSPSRLVILPNAGTTMKGFIRPLLYKQPHGLSNGLLALAPHEPSTSKYIAALILYQLTGGKST